MDQINGDTNNVTPRIMPVKRKRGRPRKDKSMENPTDITPTLNYHPPLNSVEDANGSLVGQPVTGVIEASFDAGFLLNVNIGNSGTCLRGVVFKPGYYHPVSAKNDVAPHIQMISRNKIPFPKENQNSGNNRNIGGTGNGQLLNNGSILELENLKGKDKPDTMLPNGVSQNRGLFESMQSGSNGISRPCKANKKLKVSSQPSDGHFENGDCTNKACDFEPLADKHLFNNYQSQEAPHPYNNNRMGPMSMLLQVVQEKMRKPGGSS